MKDLCVREVYKDKAGTENVTWNRVGILFEANDKQYIKLFHIPNIIIHVFEQKKRESKKVENEL